MARLVKVSGEFCLSIARGLDWPSGVLNKSVDLDPSTRELNFISIGTSGPWTVLLIAGEDCIKTAWAEAMRGTSTSATAMAIIAAARNISFKRELRWE